MTDWFSILLEYFWFAWTGKMGCYQVLLITFITCFLPRCFDIRTRLGSLGPGLWENRLMSPVCRHYHDCVRCHLLVSITVNVHIILAGCRILWYLLTTSWLKCTHKCINSVGHSVPCNMYGVIGYYSELRDVDGCINYALNRHLYLSVPKFDNQSVAKRRYKQCHNLIT